jgi:hypothetical protein
MSGYRIKDWEKFQHYKSGAHADKPPEWIKLYPKLLNDIEFHKLSGDDAKTLMMLWMLASENGGTLPSFEKIAFRLRLPEKQIKSVLSRLPHWVEGPSRDCLEPVYTASSPEEEENKKENKKENKNESGARAPLAILKTILDEEHAEAVIAYRTKGKQSNSPLAITRLANQFSRYRSPNEGAAEMICRGWKGFDPEWMNGNRGNDPPRNGGGLKAPLAFKPDEKEIAKPPSEDRERQVQRLLRARPMHG